jgi:hypothetical protein
MEQIKAIITKISTNKDQTVRITCDSDKFFTEGINLLAWQDKEVTIILKEE